MEKVKIPELPQLTFEEKDHVYRLFGNPIPSVSEILVPLKESHYKSIPDKVMEKAAEKGTEVHSAIEMFIKYRIDDITEENSLYYEAFKKWWNEYKPDVIGSEVPIYHQVMLYGGTIDLLAYIDNELWLIDFKTTYQVVDMTCRIQLSGYENALLSHGVKVDRKAVLQLKRNGDYDFGHKYIANDAQAWRVFGSLKSVYDYIKSN